MSLDLSNPQVAASLKLLENDSDIKPIQKALIIQVALGKKPATWQIYESEKWDKGTAKNGISSERWNNIDRMLSGLGLQYIANVRLNDDIFAQPSDGNQQWVELGDMFIAQTKEIATQLADAVQVKDDRCLGELFGFPTTAIDAYLSKDCVAIDQRPEFTDTVTRNEMRFLNHMISKQHWHDELQYLPEFASDTQRISSKIYQDCIT